jgi:hypothetical protein
MKKTLLVVFAALTLFGSMSLPADPPAPFCPPACDPPAGGSGSSLINFDLNR